MTIEEAILARLEADATVTSVLDGRIYPQQVQQGASFPAASYQNAGTRQAVTLDGLTDHYETRLKVDTYGLTYASAKAAADAVNDSLAGFVGVLGSVGNQLRVRGILQPAASDEIEPPQHGAEGGIHKVALDYLVIYQMNV